MIRSSMTKSTLFSDSSLDTSSFRKMYSIKRKKYQSNLTLNLGDQSVIMEEPELQNNDMDGLLSVSKSPRRFRDMLTKDGVSPRSPTSRSPSVAPVGKHFNYTEPFDSLQTSIADIVHKLKNTGDNLWRQERDQSELEYKISMLDQTLEAFRTRVTELEAGIQRLIQAKANQTIENLYEGLAKLLENKEFQYEIREISRLSDNPLGSRQHLHETREVKLLPSSQNLLASDSNLSHPGWLSAPKRKPPPIPRGSVALDEVPDSKLTPPMRRRIYSSNISPNASGVNDGKKITPQPVESRVDEGSSCTPDKLQDKQDFGHRRRESLRFHFLEHKPDGVPEELESVLSPVVPKHHLPVMRSDDSFKMLVLPTGRLEADVNPPNRIVVSEELRRNSAHSSVLGQQAQNLAIHEPEPERLASQSNENHSELSSRASRRKTLVRVLGLKQDFPLAERSAPRPEPGSGLITGQHSTHTIELRGVLESKHKDGALVINLRNVRNSGVGNHGSSRRMSGNENSQNQRLEGFMRMQAERSPDLRNPDFELPKQNLPKQAFSDYLLPRPLIRISQAEPNISGGVGQETTRDQMQNSNQLLSSSRTHVARPPKSPPKPGKTGLQTLLASMKNSSHPPTAIISKKIPNPLQSQSSDRQQISTPADPNIKPIHKSSINQKEQRSVLPGTFANPSRFKGLKDNPDI